MSRSSRPFVVYYDRSTSNKHTHLPPTTRMHTKETVKALCQILWSVCEGSTLVPQNKFLTFYDNSNVSRRSFCAHERQTLGMENATMSWQSLPIVSLFNQCSSVALNIPVVCIYAWEKAALCPALSQNTPSHHTVCLLAYDDRKIFTCILQS